MEKSFENVSNNDLFDLADLFKVFSDSTRIRILFSLFENEKNVNTISNELGLSQSATSHQLRYLKDSNLVKSRRNGQSIFYALSDSHVEFIIELGLEHLHEDN
ncbi:MAG: metalloregulator ArsR/SmtB family transcription factor [Anaerococcus hydrogenalis]|uniref:ArsR/SmtB family transcription factor n=1 Tax=Anaerococcus hydrogenalis TaxID=33029 RepID=UPI00290271EC|nr:metalloregulator ArsR/SmtB family transcription factor [Anaerococcus hydrogenalis]MDU2583466.1 metalloregulator ArsR/SmtB family transcription factor [Anaerococcus hydrogenalis]